MSAFNSYEVPDLGTVENHGDAGDVYHIRLLALPNQVNAYPAPAGQQCDPERAATDIAEAIANPPIAATPVPQEVPMWSLRAILDLAGLTASIDAVLANHPEPDRTIITGVWQNGNYIRRNSPTIAGLAVALNKTEAEVNSYFIQAASLNP